MRQVSLSTLVRQQVARLMEKTDLPAVQVIARMRYGVWEGGFKEKSPQEKSAIGKNRTRKKRIRKKAQ